MLLNQRNFIVIPVEFVAIAEKINERGTAKRIIVLDTRRYSNGIIEKKYGAEYQKITYLAALKHSYQVYYYFGNLLTKFCTTESLVDGLMELEQIDDPYIQSIVRGIMIGISKNHKYLFPKFPAA